MSPADDPHAAFLAPCAPDIRERLEAIQVEVERRVPGAKRDVGYKMPAYRQRKIFFYFAPFKNHIGVYPPVSGPPELIARLKPYRGPKGSLSFPHDQPLPIDLISEVAAQLAEQYAD